MTTTTRTTDPVAALLNSERLSVTEAGPRLIVARTRASDGSGAVYVTRIHEDRWCSCSCPARRYRPRAPCTHIRALARVAAPSLRAAVGRRRGGPAGEEGEE